MCRMYAIALIIFILQTTSTKGKLIFKIGDHLYGYFFIILKIVLDKSQ